MLLEWGEKTKMAPQLHIVKEVKITQLEKLYDQVKKARPLVVNNLVGGRSVANRGQTYILLWSKSGNRNTQSLKWFYKRWSVENKEENDLLKLKRVDGEVFCCFCVCPVPASIEILDLHVCFVACFL